MSDTPPRRPDGTFVHGHLDTATRMSLEEARERLIALKSGKHAPRPRDLMAIDVALGLFEAIQRRLQERQGSPPFSTRD